MTPINTLFDRMDAWRHLPNYQLERRADIFFSLYLPEVLEAKLGFPIRSDLIPEFPVRIGTIYKNIPIDKSYKIDYVALSAAGDKVVFVELKTDGQSCRPKQDRYLLAAQDAGLAALLSGVLDIFRATDSKPKYFCLLKQLESIGLLRIPESLTAIMAGPTLQGANEASGDVEVTAKAEKPLIVYILPNAPKVAAGQTDAVTPVIISFSEFADVVRRHDDPVSHRFAASLREWADVPAGGRKPLS